MDWSRRVCLGANWKGDVRAVWGACIAISNQFDQAMIDGSGNDSRAVAGDLLHRTNLCPSSRRLKRNLLKVGIDDLSYRRYDMPSDQCVLLPVST